MEQRTLPTSTSLWFCDSVKVETELKFDWDVIVIQDSDSIHYSIFLFSIWVGILLFGTSGQSKYVLNPSLEYSIGYV